MWRLPDPSIAQLDGRPPWEPQPTPLTASRGTRAGSCLAQQCPRLLDLILVHVGPLVGVKEVSVRVWRPMHERRRGSGSRLSAGAAPGRRTKNPWSRRTICRTCRKTSSSPGPCAPVLAYRGHPPRSRSARRTRQRPSNPMVLRSVLALGLVTSRARCRRSGVRRSRPTTECGRRRSSMQPAVGWPPRPRRLPTAIPTAAPR